LFEQALGLSSLEPEKCIPDYSSLEEKDVGISIIFLAEFIPPLSESET
jgi:hypothetical protein